MNRNLKIRKVKKTKKRKSFTLLGHRAINKKVEAARKAERQNIKKMLLALYEGDICQQQLDYMEAFGKDTKMQVSVKGYMDLLEYLSKGEN